MKNLRCLVSGLCFLIGSLARAMSAQLSDEAISTLISDKDAVFWQAYNACDIDTCRRLFADDVEFYHDKGGLTTEIDALTGTMKSNLCGNARSHLRREAVGGTVQVFPLRKGADTYGAIWPRPFREFVAAPERRLENGAGPQFQSSSGAL
jgi:hypothetical protein